MWSIWDDQEKPTKNSMDGTFIDYMYHNKSTLNRGKYMVNIPYTVYIFFSYIYINIKYTHINTIHAWYLTMP